MGTERRKCNIRKCAFARAQKQESQPESDFRFQVSCERVGRIVSRKKTRSYLWPLLERYGAIVMTGKHSPCPIFLTYSSSFSLRRTTPEEREEQEGLNSSVHCTKNQYKNESKTGAEKLNVWKPCCGFIMATGRVKFIQQKGI